MAEESLAKINEIKVELSAAPKCEVVYMPNAVCTVCGGKHVLRMEVADGGFEQVCLICLMEKTDKEFLIINGWKLQRHATVVICNRLAN